MARAVAGAHLGTVVAEERVFATASFQNFIALAVLRGRTVAGARDVASPPEESRIASTGAVVTDSVVTAESRALENGTVLPSPSVLARTNSLASGRAAPVTVTVVFAFGGGAVGAMPEFVADALSGRVLANSVGATVVGAKCLFTCPACKSGVALANSDFADSLSVAVVGTCSSGTVFAIEAGVALADSVVACAVSVTLLGARQLIARDSLPASGTVALPLQTHSLDTSEGAHLFRTGVSAPARRTQTRTSARVARTMATAVSGTLLALAVVSGPSGVAEALAVNT